MSNIIEAKTELKVPGPPPRKKRRLHEVLDLDVIDPPIPPARKAKRVVISLHRKLTNEEKDDLNKCFSCLTFDPRYHGKKKLSELITECLIVNALDKDSFVWEQQNLKAIKESSHYIGLMQKGRKLDIGAIKTQYSYTNVVKRLPHMQMAELFISCLFDHVSAPTVSCLDSVCALVSDCKGSAKKKHHSTPKQSSD